MVGAHPVVFPHLTSQFGTLSLYVALCTVHAFHALYMQPIMEVTASKGRNVWCQTLGLEIKQMAQYIGTKPRTLNIEALKLGHGDADLNPQPLTLDPQPSIPPGHGDTGLNPEP